MTFEAETCGRCGGSGHYSYCQMYGTTCFGCSGSGVKYTKRGAAAFAFYNSLREKPAKDFVPGDLLYFAPGPFNKGGFRKVIAVGPDLNPGYISIQCEGYGYACSAENLCRFGLTAEQKAEFKARALAYQETLTKQGASRKRSADSTASALSLISA